VYILVIQYSQIIIVLIILIQLKLHNVYSSSIIRMIKSRRIRWKEHLASMGEKGNACKGPVGNQKEKDHWADLDVDGRIVIKWIFEK
jgi:hypothetical protein